MLLCNARFVLRLQGPRFLLAPAHGSSLLKLEDTRQVCLGASVSAGLRSRANLWTCVQCGL